MHKPLHCARLRKSIICLATLVAETASAQTLIESDLTQPPEFGGVRRWEVIDTGIKGYAAPDFQAEANSTHSAGTVVSNLGCEPIADLLWCEVEDTKSGIHYIPARDLRPAPGPDGVVAKGVDDSRQRARKRDFDASDRLPCAQEQGQALATCEAAVARSGGGDATVVVTFWNGFQRSLYFAFGKFVRASSTMSGVGTDIDWSLDGNDYVIRVDDQRFTVATAFVLGTD